MKATILLALLAATLATVSTAIRITIPGFGKRCTAPKSPANGYLPNRKPLYSFGRKIRFRCNNGYRLVKAKTSTCFLGKWFPKPSGKCVDIDECRNAGACGQNAICKNSDGKFDCSCPPGHTGDPFVQCSVMDFCASNPCGGNANCANVVGRHNCTCRAGYSGDPYVKCNDVNECLTRPCGSNSICTNTGGSFTCKCRRGYEGNSDGTDCKDINECKVDPDRCGNNSNCFNIPGRHFCFCQLGFKKQGAQCVPKSECPPPTPPLNGKVSPRRLIPPNLGSSDSKYYEGDVPNFICNTHYKIVYPRNSPFKERYVCGSNGAWIGTKPTCEESCIHVCRKFPYFLPGLPPRPQTTPSPPCGCSSSCKLSNNCCTDYDTYCDDSSPILPPTQYPLPSWEPNTITFASG